MVKALITRRIGRTSAFSAIVELVAGTCRLREPYMSMVVCMILRRSKPVGGPLGADLRVAP